MLKDLLAESNIVLKLLFRLSCSIKMIDICNHRRQVLENKIKPGGLAPPENSFNLRRSNIDLL